MFLEAKFGQHLLNRQSKTCAREDIHLDVFTMADWVAPARPLWRRWWRCSEPTC